nr:PREDICTED: nitric oxide-associated protein 1 [Megachile rotundata]XP_012154157.1 PREDICTED: nitric oxide-associated protein 1 [Megachile rotundata]
MYISGIRRWLFQLNSEQVNHVSRFRCPKRKGLYRNIQSKVDPKVVALREKILYCDHLDLDKVRMGHKMRLRQTQMEKKQKEKVQFHKLTYEPIFSVMLDNEMQEESKEESRRAKLENNTSIDIEKQAKSPYMPYATTASYEIINDDKFEKYVQLQERYLEMSGSGSEAKNSLHGKANNDNDRYAALPEGELWKVPKSWMFDYEQYDETPIDATWYKSYGTPDPASPVSSVPCGGCGALLHCKDAKIPGYLPSELFSNQAEEDLKLTICQRCHFLKFYKAALKVNVSIEDYPKLLKVIKRKKCAIILVVDLTDFPCSIWPDLKSIMHPFTPIFLVGNKVDALPRDRSTEVFLTRIKQLLADTVVDITGISKKNIMHVEIISALTKFGIEQLINKLQYKWSVRGDVYLVGCTNVGKSTLFNVLLNSDYCKVQAIDLIPRSTVSPWPGTTLNLLKFPLLNMNSERCELRTRRLMREQPLKQELMKYRNEEFKRTRKIKYATLKGHVGRTFSANSTANEPFDSFVEKSHKFMSTKPTFDESAPEYKESRWCYDTPGTVQTDQILDLLTTDELMLTLPKVTVLPRTFDFKPQHTVFVAGLGRLDYVDGRRLIRCTLFTSNELPITICYTDVADEVYDQLLETEAFVVPSNEPERLRVWPKLESKEYEVTGIYKESAADIVLSNAGWIAITPAKNEKVVLRAWTPQGRGIHLRRPALLSKSVHFRGCRIPNTPLYTLGRQAYGSK